MALPHRYTAEYRGAKLHKKWSGNFFSKTKLPPNQYIYYAQQFQKLFGRTNLKIWDFK